MDRLRLPAAEQLRVARKELVETPKDSLTGDTIGAWVTRWSTVFERAEALTGALLLVNIGHFMQGYWEEEDVDLCDELRVRVADLLDGVVRQLDTSQPVRPILQDNILRTSDTKLATLLQEFDQVQTRAPNLSAIAFRTILTLIIRERAKIVAPSSTLATKDDLGFEPDIKEAVKQGIFSAADARLLKRYLAGGDKDVFDNVAHKPEALVAPDELEDAVNLLNRLLPALRAANEEIHAKA